MTLTLLTTISSSATLEVKSKAPNGVSFTVKGKSGHKQGDVGGSVSLRVPSAADKKSFTSARLNRGNVLQLEGKYVDGPTGLALTQAWTTANVLNTKLELDNTLAKGFKAEGVFNFHPKDSSFSPLLNFYYKQPMVTARAFFDLYKGPTANVDAVVGDRGFLAGAEAGYDVQKAAFTRYSGTVGYSVPEYTAAVSATNNLSVISAMYYHRVNSQVEAGAKALWDTKSNNTVGLEVAGKYRVDPTSFIKVRWEVLKVVE